jgi:hypothetical protein
MATFNSTPKKRASVGRVRARPLLDRCESTAVSARSTGWPSDLNYLTRITEGNKKEKESENRFHLPPSLVFGQLTH